MTELPKPAVYAYNVETRCNNLSAFSADQLRDYGRAEYLRAIEDAAKVCDAQEKKSVAAMVKTKRVKDRDIYSAAAQTVHWVGDAIRALKEQQT